MEKDLLQEYGMESISDAEEEEEGEGQDENNQSDHETENDEAELDRMRKQVEDEVKFSEEKVGERDSSKVVNFNIQNYMTSLAQSTAFDKNDEVDEFEDALDDLEIGAQPLPVVQQDDIHESSELNKTAESIAAVHLSNASNDDNDLDGNVSSGGEDDELGDLDPKSREYRFKMVEKLLNDARSHRSYSTTASTIAPSVIKDRIKKNLDFKEKNEIRKRCVAKGEASATTRIRKENRDTCKEYKGWDF